MHITVLVEPVSNNNGFRAKTGEPLPLSAEGSTADEAVQNLRAALDRTLTNGRQLVSVDVAAPNPWLAMAGMHDPSDPLVQAWKSEMGAYRKEIDNDPSL